jgi:hypothetical protein
MRRPAAVLFVLSLAVLALALVPAAGLAGKGGGGGGKPGGGGGGGKPGGGGGGSCTRAAPHASVDNSYAWGAKGSFGLPGQQLKYAINVFNHDVGCGSTTFVVSMSAPSGFSVSMQSSTITLNSASSGYLWATITSPSPVADGDYPLNVTVTRSGTSDATGPFASLYKVYSSDSVAPRLYYPNPWDGATVSGGSYAFAVASTDDHAVKRIDLYVDNVYRSTSPCDNITYECQLYYVGSPGGAGQHTATFKSYDWMGNVATLTTTFTVN